MAIFGMVSTNASRQYTPHAVESFYRHTPLEHVAKLYLIDNDGSLTASDYAQYPNLEFILNPEPLSFAANANAILRKALAAETDLFFLNNDLIFTPAWLEPLLIDTPEVLSPLSNREVTYVKDLLRCERALDLDGYLGREQELEAITQHHRTKHSGYKQVISFPFFCVKIPYSVAIVVGELDESFGRGGAEDNDYALRAYLEGFSLKYAAASYVLHFSGRSTWNGAETAAESREREQKYMSRFIEKWGERLARLVIRFDQTALAEIPSAASAAKAGDYRTAILELKGGDAVSTTE